MTIPWKKLVAFPSLSSLSPAALQALADVAVNRYFADSEIIQFRSEECHHVHFILSGFVRVYISNTNGREKNMCHLQPGDLFNLAIAFLPDSDLTANAVAVGNVETISIPFSALRELASSDTEIAYAIIQILAKKLSTLTEVIQDTSLRSVRSRLAHFLIQYSQNPQRRWNQYEIAVQIGTVREVVTRTMKSFVDEGLISFERQKIVIINPDALYQVSQE